jgi:outer membrane protein
MIAHPMTSRPLATGLLAALLPLTSQAASLDDSIDAALQHNPGLQAAIHRVDAAEAALREAQASLYPHITLNADYALTDNPTRAFMMTLNRRAFDLQDPALDFNNPDDTDHLHLQAGVTYPLLQRQRETARRIRAHGVDAEAHAHAAYLNHLVYLVQAGYYRALQAREHIAVRADAVTSLSESLRAARARLDAGAAVITDVLNLEVQVAQAQEEHIRARNSLELAVAALNTTIGTPLITATNLIASPDTTPPLPPPQPEQLDHHPELRATQTLLDLRDAEIQHARRAYAPTLNAFGTYDLDSEAARDFENSYTVGLMASWEVFDGFRRPSQVAAARARQAAAAAQLIQTRQQLELDLHQAHTRARDAQERLAVASASVASAEQALAITRDQYEQGATTLADLLTAQTGATATRSRRTAAFYDYLTALANQQRAAGTLPYPTTKEEPHAP